VLKKHSSKQQQCMLLSVLVISYRDAIRPPTLVESLIFCRCGFYQSIFNLPAYRAGPIQKYMREGESKVCYKKNHSF